MKTINLSLQLGILFLIAACQTTPVGKITSLTISPDNVLKVVESRTNEYTAPRDSEENLLSARYLQNLKDPNLDL